MSCHEITTRSALLAHLTQHVTLECPRCYTGLIVDDGAIAFGNAQMVTCRCAHCNEEKIFVISEDGKILTLEDSLCAATT